MSYAASFIPIIVLVSILMILVFIAMIALVTELVDKGCLTWHRDALGTFVQILICLSCTLVACLHLRGYIEDYEIHPKETIRTQSMMSCLTPILTMACLACVKIMLFRVKQPWVAVIVMLSLASMVFAFESHFDNEQFEAPLFVVAIPVAFILLAFTWKTLFELRDIEDFDNYVFKGYDFQHKRILAWFNAAITVIFVLQQTVALYFLEREFTNLQVGK